MTIDELRAVAGHHLERSKSLQSAAEGMGPCPAAAFMRQQSRQHATWFQGLSEIADAFDTFKQLSAQQPSAKE